MYKETQRERFARSAMQGFLSNPEYDGDVDILARDAVEYADGVIHLLKALKEEEKPGEVFKTFERIEGRDYIKLPNEDGTAYEYRDLNGKIL